MPKSVLEVLKVSFERMFCFVLNKPKISAMEKNNVYVFMLRL